MRWYQRQWWYVERPFPWAAILVYLAPVALIVAAVIVEVSR
jgi:hypothetical protein